MKSIIFLFSFVSVISSFQVFSEGWSEKLKGKIDTVVKSTYQLESFELKEIGISSHEEEKTTAVMSDHLFEVTKGGSPKGFIFVSQAPSMKNIFDYIVLFDPDFQILNTKILIYREQHGRQIGTKRWLSQFFGMTPKDRPELGAQIDGITGATISANSMTHAIHNLLESIDYLKSRNFLNE